MSDEEWRMVRTKVYYAEYRRGKVGELVNCWAYNHKLREGEIIIRRPNGNIAVADEREFFQKYEKIDKTP